MLESPAGGLGQLAEAGIEVVTGILEQEAQALNRTYLHHRVTGRPFVSLKLALSLDGRLAAPDGSARWISGPGSAEGDAPPAHGGRRGGGGLRHRACRRPRTHRPRRGRGSAAGTGSRRLHGPDSRRARGCSATVRSSWSPPTPARTKLRPRGRRRGPRS